MLRRTIKNVRDEKRNITTIVTTYPINPKVDPRGADLRGADLNGEILSEANLSEANLSGAELSGTKYNKYTIFPDNFNPETAEMKFIEDGDE